MTLTKTIKQTVLAIGLAVAALPAAATTNLALDGGWQSFIFGGVGSSWSDDFAFTIGAGETAYLAVTDAFLSGDQFEFFSSGVSLGVTSLPTTQGDQIGTDADAAYADPRWSSGEAQLGAGTYAITGSTILSPFGSGAAYIQLSSTSLGGPVIAPPTSTPTIPLPAAAWMLLAGLGGLGVLRARRKG